MARDGDALDHREALLHDVTGLARRKPLKVRRLRVHAELVHDLRDVLSHARAHLFERGHDHRPGHGRDVLRDSGGRDEREREDEDEDEREDVFHERDIDIACGTRVEV